MIDLGKQYLQGSFVKPGKEDPPRRLIPTTLARCNPERDENACGLLQMEHSVPPEILYSAYWYRSGTNSTMRNHLAAIAQEAVALWGSDTARVLDIGCNDGTLLAAYPNAFHKIGVDPSDVAQSVPQDITVIQDTFPTAKLDALLQGKKLDVITSIAMFYDLEDPVGFAREVRRVLSSDGLWCFEMSYMPTMLARTSYDTICHEHLEYYSLAVLERILRAADLQLIRAALNPSNGGSIRCFATHSTSQRYRAARDLATIAGLRQQEFELELDTDRPYRDFQARTDEHRNELTALLRSLRNQGKRVHIYGASTKGNTILQWCGIDTSVVEVAAERNPDKYGAFTLGTNIPIVSEEESRKMHPDYYLVLPWHFRDEFIERERAMLADGVGFIFPLPKVEIVMAGGVA